MYRHNWRNSMPCRSGLRAGKLSWDLGISASLSFGPGKALAKKNTPQVDHKYLEKRHFSAVWLICCSFLSGHVALHIGYVGLISSLCYTIRAMLSCCYVLLRPGAAYCPESSNWRLSIILQHAQTPAQGHCLEISQATNPKP